MKTLFTVLLMCSFTYCQQTVLNCVGSLTTSGGTYTCTPVPIVQPPPMVGCTGICYYISPTGNDSNVGTSTGAAWKTIAKVQSFQASLKPGVNVLFERGGVWSEELDITNMNGISGQPITISAYGTGALPVIDGGQTGSTKGRNYCIAALNTTYKWITVDSIECRNAYMQGITFQAYSGTGSNGVGIVVQNSYIHHTGAGACTSCATSSVTDSGGYVNQLDAQHTTGVQFLNNVIDHCGGHNCVEVHYDDGHVVISGNKVGTLAPYCNHNCIDTKGGSDVHVTNNIVTCPSCPKATAAFYTENTYEAHEVVTYTGNVAYNVPIGLQADSGGSCSVSPCSINLKFYNNTIYNPSVYSVIDSVCTAGSVLDFQKNIFDGGKVVISSGCTKTWDYNVDGGVNPLSGNPVGSHDIKQVNPQYINPTIGNFTPQNPTVTTLVK